MRIVLNTRADDHAARLAITGLAHRLAAAGVDATLNDWESYDRYDVAVFLGYDHELEAARRANPHIRVVLVDPKQSRAEWIEAARNADQLVVSSVEQRDVFYRLNRNILVWSMFPAVQAVEKVHVEKEPIVIGYHGNRVHLEAMCAQVRPALEELGRRRRIELWAVYNVKALGRASAGVPDEKLVRVRHIQWSENVLLDELAQADIGIVPNELPVNAKLDALERIAFDDGRFAYEPFDHLIRLKASANQGRLYAFARLGVPVVTDFAPSCAQFVRDGVSGFVVSSPYGWFEALESLCNSPSLRTRMAAALREKLDAEYERQLGEFVEFCSAELKPAPVRIPGWPTPEEELARLGAYPAVTSPVRRRLLGRLRRLLR